MLRNFSAYLTVSGKPVKIIIQGCITTKVEITRCRPQEPGYNALLMQLMIQRTRLPILLLIALAIFSGCQLGITSRHKPSGEPVPTLFPTAEPVSGPGRIADLGPRISDKHSINLPLTAELFTSGSDQISVAHPSLFAAEVTGPALQSMTRYVTATDQGGSKLFSLERIEGEVGAGQNLHWPAGVHKLTWIWMGEGHYLDDGQNGDFVVLDPEFAEDSQSVVAGSFRSGSESAINDALMLIEPGSRQVSRILDPASKKIVTARPGDEFRVTTFFRKPGGMLEERAGVTLIFDEEGIITYERKPLPPGIYSIGLEVIAVSGKAADSAIERRVAEATVLPGFRTCLSPELGIQFLYPAAWPDLQGENGAYVSGEKSPGTTLTLSLHPEMAGRSVEELSQMALQAFGPVQLLYRDNLVVERRGGLRNIYGYEGVDGPRTGVFMALIIDGKAYVVDVDGPAEDEAATLEIARIVAESWTQRSDVDRDYLGRWKEIRSNGLLMVIPAEFTQDQGKKGWMTFTEGDPETYFAILQWKGREDPEVSFSGRPLEAPIPPGRSGATSPVYDVQLGEREWQRVDYAYQSSSGESKIGFLMSTTDDQGTIQFQAEAPETVYWQLESEIFHLVAAGTQRLALSG